MQKRVDIPDDYSIYQDRENEEQFYAVHFSEIDRMFKKKLEFEGRELPGEFTVLAFKLGKVFHPEKQSDIYEIISKDPINIEVNRLISKGIELIL